MEGCDTLEVTPLLKEPWARTLHACSPSLSSHRNPIRINVTQRVWLHLRGISHEVRDTYQQTSHHRTSPWRWPDPPPSAPAHPRSVARNCTEPGNWSRTRGHIRERETYEQTKNKQENVVEAEALFFTHIPQLRRLGSGLLLWDWGCWEMMRDCLLGWGCSLWTGSWGWWDRVLQYLTEVSAIFKISLHTAS